MKKLFLIPAVALILLCLVLAAIAFYGYHAPPELVKEVIWSPGLLEIAPDGAIYGNETAQKFFEKQSFSPPQNIYYGKKSMESFYLAGQENQKTFRKLL